MSEQAFFFGKLARRIGRVVKRAAPVIRKVAKVAVPIAGAAFLTKAALARKSRPSDAGDEKP